MADVSCVEKHVEESLQRRRLLGPGGRVVVAVSGGVDSMALLQILHRLAAVNRWRLTIAHFNHQLRGRSSDADERLVRRTGEKLGLPVVVERGDVRAFARKGKMSIEMAARRLRHEFLARAAVQAGARCIALAHHADDQIELFFLRLLRGSGGEGLGGMKWRAPSPANPKVALIRPLLDLPKADLSRYAAENRLAFREDATNSQIEIQRNRVRHELLPLLRKHYQPALDKVILRAMEILGAEAEFAAEAAEAWGAATFRPAGRGAGKPRPAEGPVSFAALPLAVKRWWIRRRLLDLGVEPDFDLVEELRLNTDKPVSVTPDGGSGGGRPAGCSVICDAQGNVELRKAQRPEFDPDSLDLDLRSGSGRAPFGEAIIRWKTRACAGMEGLAKQAGREVFDADKVGSRVRLRHWRPGDRFQPIGMAQAVKVQDLFTNRKI